ncbi:MAG: NAD-dependent protein deacylase [Clostridia bacterium]|nr:NAD-dependent protein deacylase [Clostridia bacterium]
MTEETAKLNELINGSDNIVFFGGAGVSTESGIPDFRSVDGLYSQKFSYPPETILSHSFYLSHKAEFYDFYRAKMLALDAEPNAAHIKLAELEKAGKLRAVITQNIDGLHQKAGSKEVLELHGSVWRNHCERCGRFYGVEAVTGSDGVPKCVCGGDIKPDVVLYEEGLDGDVLDRAVRFIRQADMLIIGGTSLTVYPAAGLVRYYRGSKLVVINKGGVGQDIGADLIINAPIGQIMSGIKLSRK